MAEPAAASVAAPGRVLLVYRALFHGRDEALEVRELIAGIGASAPTGSLVDVTNGREIFRVDGDDLVPAGPFRWRAARYDIAHVHLALPPAHLWLALGLRLRGARIVLTPMAMLGADFAQASWFRRRGPAWQRIKPVLVALQRRLWSSLAAVMVCASREEIVQGRLRESRCVLAPLAAPDSPAARMAASTSLAGDRPPDGPIAFTTRFDVHRKGIDRLWTWVDAHREDLPRPAVLLLAPSDGRPPAPLQSVIDDGLVEWDATTRGADLVERLAACRGQMLLSRYDGQPRVLREAALLGLPTVSTVASHFSDVVAALGTGLIVDGDDPADIQAGFDALPGQPRRAAAARRLFDRDRIGAYLWSVYGAASGGARPPSSYYDLPLESAP